MVLQNEREYAMIQDANCYGLNQYSVCFAFVVPILLKQVLINVLSYY